MREWRVTLPHPPGVNRQYTIAGRRIILTRPAREWSEAAAQRMMVAGMRRLPPGVWMLTVRYELYSRRLDVDAPAKLLLDTLCRTLDVDDRHVSSLTATVARVDKRADQRLEAIITAAQL